MGPRGTLPRNFIDNARGNNLQIGNRRDFGSLQQTARTAMLVLGRLDDPTFTLGTAAQNKRLRSFTWFGYAAALGNVALTYDSAGIPAVTDGETDIPTLVGYKDVMARALVALDSAIALANDAETLYPIPAAWFAQASGVSKARYLEILYAYKARFRAGVARTVEERAAVDWSQVIADAGRGLKSDFTLTLTPSAGWDYSWLVQMYTTGAANWHQMVQLMIGMADTTVVGGAAQYETWLRTPRDNRAPFLVVTPDKRFPAGTTRAAQQANSPDVLPAGQYIRNRPSGEDQPSSSWGQSFYSHHRWRGLQLASRVGPWVTFSQVENDMLAAEGYIRTGQFGLAAALIDRSRVRNGLPSTAGLTALGQPVAGGTDAAPVPGGASCVPRVPNPAQDFVGTKCGDILEAMKWEKRMESAYSSYATWFTDSRGWGDLPEGTAVHWPVPWQEMDARVLPFYNYGGVGREGGAPASVTYGFGTGAR
jgi:hypothetical protein